LTSIVFEPNSQLTSINFSTFGSLYNLTSITQERAIELILAKRTLEANKFIKEFPNNDSVKIVNGMFGPYIQIGKRNVKIPKGQKPEDLTLDECIALGDAAPAATKKRKK
jgi:DNA topoisomerase-1